MLIDAHAHIYEYLRPYGPFGEGRAVGKGRLRWPDGTEEQFFHSGERGNHSAWGTKVFDYGKSGVVRFLLSNLKFWMDKFHFDGFRFDGITSMLYWDHGLEKTFTGYENYFDKGVDENAIAYLALANILVRDINPDAFTIAILAAIESLLSCVVADGMIHKKHRSNTELVAQGMGNVASALFGGIPATGAIARTAANVKNGGRSPISGMVHAVILVLFLLVLMPVAKMIPMPIIAAILFIVAYNMSSWRMFVRICKRSPKTDIFILVLSFFLTVFFDLVVAIAVGLMLAAVLFMKRMADVASIRTWTKGGENAPDSERLKEIPDNTTVIEFEGPMFFASSEKFNSITFEEGVKVVILRMRNVPALDSTAMRALNEIYSTCLKSGLTLVLSHTNEQPLSVMKKAGFYDKVGAENFLPNIDEALSYAEKINK